MYYHNNWNKFYHYSLICENTDPHNVYKHNYCNNHDPKTLYYPTEIYVCTCTTKLYVFCTGAYNYCQKMIITITLPITHLIQINNSVLDSFLRFINKIRLNKFYLYYMYPIIYIRGHYYIFNNYLYLRKKITVYDIEFWRAKLFAT